jgi:hypothetical protein
MVLNEMLNEVHISPHGKSYLPIAGLWRFIRQITKWCHLVISAPRSDLINAGLIPQSLRRQDDEFHQRDPSQLAAG